MSHVRQQIREAVGTILTTAAVASIISQSRVYVLPAETTTAALIYTLAETVIDSTLSRPRKLNRELSLMVECVARNLSNLDDALDDICISVEEALGADPTLTGLAKDCILRNTTIIHNFDGDAPIGNARLEFVILYRTTETDAEASV